jgi:hypothetical protein
MREGQHKILVSGEQRTVSVHQLSKTVWEAVGEYMGESIRVKDRTAATALKRWREAATYKGN